MLYSSTMATVGAVAINVFPRDILNYPPLPQRSIRNQCCSVDWTGFNVCTNTI